MRLSAGSEDIGRHDFLAILIILKKRSDKVIISKNGWCSGYVRTVPDSETERRRKCTG